MGRRLVLAAAVAALAAACGGQGSVADCWEDQVNRPAAEGGCQGIASPEMTDLCLAFWDQECQENHG